MSQQVVLEASILLVLCQFQGESVNFLHLGDLGAWRSRLWRSRNQDEEHLVFEEEEVEAPEAPEELEDEESPMSCRKKRLEL